MASIIKQPPSDLSYILCTTPTLSYTSSFTMNPYGQGQWQQQGSGAPSVFGALPSASLLAPTAIQADSVTFQFTNFKTTILNSTVVGPQQRTVYRVVTESMPTCTILKDNESRSVAMVQWQTNPTVEIRNVAERQRVRDWLRLSSDQRCVDLCGCLVGLLL